MKLFSIYLKFSGHTVPNNFVLAPWKNPRNWYFLVSKKREALQGYRCTVNVFDTFLATFFHCRVAQGLSLVLQQL